MTEKVKRNVLTVAEMLALAEIVRTKYKDSGLDNNAFAIYVNNNEETKKLFAQPLTRSHIATMTSALGIPNNFARSGCGPAEDAYRLSARVMALEEQMNKIVKTLNNILANSKG
jgi:hypothetical protein